MKKERIPCGEKLRASLLTEFTYNEYLKSYECLISLIYAYFFLQWRAEKI